MFGSRSTADFLRTFWQKRPLLVREALSDWQCPVGPKDLVALAFEENAESRLVRGPDATGDFEVEYGPLDDPALGDVGQSDWTLLVQDVDKWMPEVGALLKRFDFLPRWRLDDIMISLAAPGGSVGAHFDQYDVFLVQARGRRHWSIDASESPDLTLRDDTQLPVLERFSPTDEWDLAPGDMLYLPPRVPHHGVALDADCMTVSVGLRAPSSAELLNDFAGFLSERLPDDQRYADPDLVIQDRPLFVDRAAVERARQLLNGALQANDSTLAQWFGEFVTRYRLPLSNPVDHAPQILPPRVIRSPWSRWAFVEVDGATRLFVDGESYELHPGDVDLFSAEIIESSRLSHEGKQLANELLAEGMLVLQTRSV